MQHTNHPPFFPLNLIRNRTSVASLALSRYPSLGHNPKDRSHRLQTRCWTSLLSIPAAASHPPGPEFQVQNLHEMVVYVKAKAKHGHTIEAEKGIVAPVRRRLRTSSLFTRCSQFSSIFTVTNFAPLWSSFSCYLVSPTTRKGKEYEK